MISFYDFVCLDVQFIFFCVLFSLSFGSKYEIKSELVIESGMKGQRLVCFVSEGFLR